MSNDTNILRKFGANLKKERSKKGLSQEDLAHNAGFDRTYISMLERGLRNPSLKTIVDLANCLKIDSKILLEDI